MLNNISKLLIRNSKFYQKYFLSQRSANKLKKKDFPIGKYALLVFPISTFCLGTWQVYRRRWKLDLIDSLNNKLLLPPVDLPLDPNEIEKLEYRKVKVKGRFDYSNEMYIAPRSLVKSSDMSQGSLFTRQQNTIGSWVITPFILNDDHNTRILVNRGWVSKANVGKGLNNNQKNNQNDEIELVGVVRLNENRPVFGIKNDPNSQTWHHRDLQGLSNKLNTLPIFIDADYKSSAFVNPDGPVGGQTRVSLRNEHFSYIVTWYGLCILTSYLWYKKIYNKKPLLF